MGSLINYFNCDSHGKAHRADVDAIDIGWVLKNLLTIEGFDVRSRVDRLFEEKTKYFGKINTLIQKTKPSSDIQLATNGVSNLQIVDQASKWTWEETFSCNVCVLFVIWLIV